MEVQSFEAAIESTPMFFAEAPGRVNLIGEHTDYSGGFVLPVAIALRTRVELRLRNDRMVSVRSTSTPGSARVTYSLGGESKAGQWFDYVQGVTFALREAGVSIGGFDALISSTVPLGSGLSSSAALEVSLLRAIRAAFALAIDDVALARIGRAAENDFVGAPVGIMDQMASSLADERSALFLDTRSLEFERVPLPPAMEILVIDSGVAHDHATGDYRTRRDEVEAAADLLGVRELRDVGPDWVVDIAQLPDTLRRRARHVVSENARVQKAVLALKAADLPELGRLFAESHASMRDDFEVSVPAVDRLVELASTEPEVYGARLTGGGFGGAVIAIVRAGSARAVAERVVSRAGAPARVLLPLVTSGGPS